MIQTRTATNACGHNSCATATTSVSLRQVQQDRCHKCSSAPGSRRLRDHQETTKQACVTVRGAQLLAWHRHPLVYQGGNSPTVNMAPAMPRVNSCQLPAGQLALLSGREVMGIAGKANRAAWHPVQCTSTPCTTGTFTQPHLEPALPRTTCVTQHSHGTQRLPPRQAACGVAQRQSADGDSRID
jgi:hypothetical protein